MAKGKYADRITEDGLLPHNKRPDWNIIRAEYIAGGISQRKLAAKYGISETTLMKRANAEKWSDIKKETDSKSTAKAQQKTADAVATNAVIAERIREKLLRVLEREIDKLPERTGTSSYSSREHTEIDKRTGKPVKVRSGMEYKLRDLTSIYKDLTEDLMTAASETPEDDGFLAALSGSAAEDWADEEG